MKSLLPLIFAAAAAPSVSAHYFFPHFIANGNFTNYWEYVREDTQGYMPYKADYSSNNFRCNVGSDQFASKTGVYKVHAGDEIGFGTDFNALIQHPGPIQVYLSKAPGDVRQYDGSGDWFKIYELGPSAFSSNGVEWGVTNLGNITFTLPKETPPGQYLVRIEHIALHGAGDFGGAELYFNCAQIEVESDSTASPSPLVKIPGVYTGYEPGILFYMYRPWIVNYTMPGPAPWPNALDANVTASGVTVAPSATSWSLPAVTNTLGATTVSSASAHTTVSSPSIVTSSQEASTVESANAATSTKDTTLSATIPVTTGSLSPATASTNAIFSSTPVSSGARRCRARHSTTHTVTVTATARRSGGI